MKYPHHIFIISFLFLVCDVQSINIGSDTTVDRFYNRQVLYNGDAIATFAFLSGGFILRGPFVVAEFRAIFPVGTSIALNRGTLNIRKNLYFLNDTEFISLGSVVGYGHRIFLSPSMQIIPSVVPGIVTCFQWSDTHLVLSGDVTFQHCCIVFNGESSIVGRGNRLIFGQNCTIRVANNAKLVLQDIIIEGMSDTKLECLNDSSTLVFNNVKWIQDGDYTFNTGKFNVNGRWSLEGAGYKFDYATDQESSIDQDSCIELMPSFTFSYNPSVGNSDLIAFSDETSKLIVNGATLHSTATGIRLKKGTLLVDDIAILTSDASVPEEGIHFGDGILQANNIHVEWGAEAVLQIASGFLVYDNV